MKVFELYDKIVGDTISYHQTIEGAVKAMSEHVAKLAPAMQRDYGEDSKVDFELAYCVFSHEVKE
jgi:hypothetical protein